MIGSQLGADETRSRFGLGLSSMIVTELRIVTGEANPVRLDPQALCENVREELEEMLQIIMAILISMLYSVRARKVLGPSNVTRLSFPPVGGAGTVEESEKRSLYIPREDFKPAEPS